MDLTGSERGSGTGRGGVGQRRQGPGTITPCAVATLAEATTMRINVRQIRTFRVRMSFLLLNALDARMISARLLERTPRKDISCKLFSYQTLDKGINETSRDGMNPTLCALSFSFAPLREQLFSPRRKVRT
jgi:hypothetical protein